MKKSLLILTALFSSTVFAQNAQDAQITHAGQRDLIVTPAQDVPVQGAGYFEFYSSAEKEGLTSGKTTFLPGTRMDWHSHPKGQVIVVTEGVGYIQIEGQPKHTLKAGDVVFVPANAMHWHGATADTPFVQIEMTVPDAQGKVYTEGKKLTDTEYTK